MLNFMRQRAAMRSEETTDQALENSDFKASGDNINILVIHGMIDFVTETTGIRQSIGGISQTPEVVIERTMTILLRIVHPDSILRVLGHRCGDRTVERMDKGQSGCN
jgi:hypothetical protein